MVGGIGRGFPPYWIKAAPRQWSSGQRLYRHQLVLLFAQSQVFDVQSIRHPLLSNSSFPRFDFTRSLFAMSYAPLVLSSPMMDRLKQETEYLARSLKLLVPFGGDKKTAGPQSPSKLIP